MVQHAKPTQSELDEEKLKLEEMLIHLQWAKERWMKCRRENMTLKRILDIEKSLNEAHFSIKTKTPTRLNFTPKDIRLAFRTVTDQVRNQWVTHKKATIKVYESLKLTYPTDEDLTIE